MSVVDVLAAKTDAELDVLARRAEADPHASPAALKRLAEHIDRAHAVKVDAS